MGIDPQRQAALGPLSRRLGHAFSEPQWLERALTHRSVDRLNNERLEFLGDAILGMVVAEALFQRFPEADEGQLTRLRASLVNRQSLAALARELGLGPHLRLGEGERKSGGWRRESILANALEAIMGAIYLDAGLERCRDRLLAWLGPALERADPGAVGKDPKTALQEYLQARRLPVPDYRTVAEEGAPHCRRFVVECRAGTLPEAVPGEGNSRRRAEQAAAAAALQALRDADAAERGGRA